MLDLGDVVTLFVVMLLIYASYRMILMRERAFQAVTLRCRQLDLQLLDENVAMRGLWVKRDKNRAWRLWLSYDFEFSSTGDERYRGRVVILGGKVANIILPPYRLPEPLQD